MTDIKSRIRKASCDHRSAIRLKDRRSPLVIVKLVRSMRLSGYTHRTQRICRNQQLKVVFLGSNDWSVIIDAIIQKTDLIDMSGVPEQKCKSRRAKQSGTYSTSLRRSWFLLEHVIGDVGEWTPKTMCFEDVLYAVCPRPPIPGVLHNNA